MTEHEEPMQPTRQSGDDHWTRRAPDRVLRGTNAPGAKLNAVEIADMYALYADGRSKAEIARMMGVSRITVWRHLKVRDTS